MNEEMTKSEEQHLSLQKALHQCELVQNMIDISISSLEGLRTKCATSNDLTQKEIRTLEVRQPFRGSGELVCVYVWWGGSGVGGLNQCIFIPIRPGLGRNFRVVVVCAWKGVHRLLFPSGP